MGADYDTIFRTGSSHGDNYRRIDAISEVDRVYRLLDMQERNVREEVLKASSAKAAYESRAATSYYV